MQQDEGMCQNGFLLRMRFETKVFADERDKYHFLKSLQKFYERRRFSLLAFTLLDQEFACLVSTRRPAGGMVRESAPDYMRNEEKDLVNLMKRHFDEVYVPAYKRADSQEECTPAKVECRECRGKELAEAARDLHFAAVDSGIVREASDYFWCSIQNYRNRYQWEFVDMERMLSVFEDEETELLKTNRERKRYLCERNEE